MQDLLLAVICPASIFSWCAGGALCSDGPAEAGEAAIGATQVHCVAQRPGRGRRRGQSPAARARGGLPHWHAGALRQPRPAQTGGELEKLSGGSGSLRTHTSAHPTARLPFVVDYWAPQAATGSSDR